MDGNLNDTNNQYSELFGAVQGPKSLIRDQNDDGISELINTDTSLFSSKSPVELTLFRKQVQATLEVCQRVYELLNDESDSVVRRITDSESLTESGQGQELKKELLDMKRMLDAERQIRTEASASNQSSYELLVAQNENLKDELKACQTKLKAAEDVITEQSRINRSSVKEKQHVELLEAQLKMFREDFESERQDRERVQARLERVVEMFNCAQKQLEQLEKQRKSSSDLIQDRITRQHYERELHTNNRPLTSRGVYQTDTELGEAETSDSASTQNDLRSLAAHCSEVDVGASRRKSDLLCCPRCMKEFYLDNHSDLVEHIEQCHN